MNNSSSAIFRDAERQSRGFTMVELMIAITVSLFLAGGAIAMLQSTRQTFATQSQLAQLQDNERLAMTFMAEVIESAGYTPSPQTYLNTTVLPAAVVSGATFAAGQGVYGTYTAAAPGDTVTIRYGASYVGGVADNIFNCAGTQNTATNPYDVFVNKFWVDNVTDPANPVLKCTFTPTSTNVAQIVPLVNGVKNLTILYGVKRSAANTLSCADTYLDGSQMAAADWTEVCSVSIEITFLNPLKTSTTIKVKRVVAVMNWAGVNT
jgi:type IV pilus assembly protein PilW